MKIISWNVNSLRSLLKKSYLYDLLNEEKPDIICLNETKTVTDITDIEFIKTDYNMYYNHSKIKKGYSGTCIFSKIKPINIIYGLNNIDNEGRLITCEFENYFLINVYTPNAGSILQRLDYRVNIWDSNFIKYIIKLQKNKPVIVCGDLNVAHKEIDLKNPNKNLKTAGYTIEERTSFQKLLDKTKLIDTFRHLYTDLIKYTYWSYRFKSRLKNIGWRIDYFLISQQLINRLIESNILDKIEGSDHAPIILELTD